MSRARDVVEVVARALAGQPDEVEVTESDRRGQTVVELTMAPGRARPGDRPAGPHGRGGAHAGGGGRRARRPARRRRFPRRLVSGGRRGVGRRWSTVGPDRPAARHQRRSRGGAGDGLRRRALRAGVARCSRAATATLDRRGELVVRVRRASRAAGSSGSRASTDRRRRDAPRPRTCGSRRTRLQAAGAGRVLRARPDRLRGADGRTARTWAAVARWSSAAGRPAAGDRGARQAKCWCRWSTRSAGGWTSAAQADRDRCRRAG